MNVEKRTLENGLTVVLYLSPRIPITAILTWVNVGYFDEPDDVRGISHLIEHLFFKGTPTRGVNVIAQETKALGGVLNASTSYDHTLYYTVVPCAHTLKALDIQADALQNPLFDEHEMEKEKLVVAQEMKRKLDMPGAFAQEKLFELAFKAHRMRRWRIGDEAQLLGFTRDQVKNFYHQYYVPQNTTLVVAGDFDSAQVWEKIQTLYGGFEARTLSRDVGPKEPESLHADLLRLKGDIQNIHLRMGFKTPPMTHEDYPALQVLSVLMGKGKSSRLSKTLKEEKAWVSGIGMSAFAFRDVGVTVISAEMNQNKLQEVEEEVWMELLKLSYDPPTLEEIQKVRSIIEANVYREQEEVYGQAHTLAFFESLGGFEKFQAYVHALRSVTPEQVVRVLKKYFKVSNLSILEYVPRVLGDGADAEGRLMSLSARVSNRIEKVSSKMIPQDISAPADLEMPVSMQESKPLDQIQVQTLISGARWVHVQSAHTPLVAVQIQFPGGRLDETPGNCGLTNFMLRNMVKGTLSQSQEELAFEMEKRGMVLGFEATADHFGVSLEMLSKDFDVGLELLSGILFEPLFSPVEMEKERNIVLHNIQKTKEDNFKYPIELFYASLYGQHPYGLPRHGSELSVSHFNMAQIKDWYAQVMRFEKMVISVVGDVSFEVAQTKIQQYFSSVENTHETKRAQIYAVIPNRTIHEKSEITSRNQTGVCLGFNGVEAKDPSYPALEVLRNVLSGMGGRLFEELREKNPLVYTATSFNIALQRGGAFFVYLACSVHNEIQARNQVLNVLANLKTKLLSSQELSMAKAFCKGSFHLSLQTNRAIAFLLAHEMMLGHDPKNLMDYAQKIDRVTSSDVLAAASKIFHAGQYAVGVVRGEPNRKVA